MTTKKTTEVNETTANEVAPTEMNELTAIEKELMELGSDFIRADNELSGMDDLKAYVKLPFAKFFAKSYNGYKSGDLVLHYDTEQEERINLNKTPLVGVQIINVAYQRIAFEGQWSKTNGETNLPFCRSFDGKYGADGGRYAGQECAKCPAASWDLARKEGGPTATPSCKENIVLLIRIPGHDTPFHLTVKGINIKPFNEFAGPFKKYVEKLRTYSFAFNLTMSAKLFEHANGENDVFVFSSTKGKPLVDKEDLVKAKEILDWYREDYLDMMRSASMVHDIEASKDEGEEAESNQSPF